MGKRIDIETMQLAKELSTFNCDENDCEKCAWIGTSEGGVYCDDLYLANKLVKDGYRKLNSEEQAVIEAYKKNDLHKVIIDNVEVAVQDTVEDIIVLIKCQGEYPELIEVIKHNYGVK